MASTITPEELRERYQAYIFALNAQDWSSLSIFLAQAVNHNGKILDHEGYRNLIPAETHFVVADLLVDSNLLQVASRLEIVVDGEKLTEHVFYRFNEDLKIERVWSIVQDGEITE